MSARGGSRLRRTEAVGGWTRTRVRPPGVRRGVGEPQEERRRFRGPAADEVDRLSGQHILLEVGLVVTVLSERPVVVEGVVVDPLLIGSGRVPFRPAGRHRGIVLVVVQILADQRRVVAGVLQPDGEVVVTVEGLEALEAAVRARVAPHAVVVGVLAGEEGRARRAAERVVDEAVRERRPLVADQRVGAVHHLHRLERLVVGLDHHHVGPGLRGGRRAERRRARAGEGERRNNNSEERDQQRCLDEGSCS